MVLIAMSVVLFISFTVFERKGIITYGRFNREKQKGEKGSVRMLFQRQIVKFCLVSILTGVVRTSVLFWLPTYFSERLAMGTERATLTFTVMSFLISFGSFIVVFIYEKLLRHDMDKTVLVMFSCAVVGFTLTYFVSATYVNVVIIVLSIMSSNGAATMLWSRYCPSLRDTGIVSGVTGFLDFLSYMAAATANLVFADAATTIGWGWLILVWFCLMLVGIAIALPYDKFKAHK
jgi:sugar phosphate permease